MLKEGPWVLFEGFWVGLLRPFGPLLFKRRSAFSIVEGSWVLFEGFRVPFESFWVGLLGPFGPLLCKRVRLFYSGRLLGPVRRLQGNILDASGLVCWGPSGPFFLKDAPPFL